MHRDTKVGLALGVLLVGVVGAFFFRNEGKSQVDVPQLANAAAVDEHLAGKSVIPYLDNGAPPPVDANGRVPSVPRTTGSDAAPWELPPAPADGIVDDADLLGDPLPAVGRNGIAAEAVARTRRVSDTNGTSVNGERFHVVEAGDTLTGIASEYLGSTGRYLELYEANRDQMSSPDRLKLGQKLRIPNGRTAGSTRIEAAPSPATRSTRPVESPSQVPLPRTLSDEDDHPSAAGPLPTLGTIEVETIELPPIEEERATTVEPAGPRGKFSPVRRTPFVPQ